MKTSMDFLRELGELHQLLRKREQGLESFFRAIEEDVKESNEYLDILDAFLAKVDLEPTQENRLVAAGRLISLREDPLVQLLKRAGQNQESIDGAIDIAYEWVKNFHGRRHEEFINLVEKKGFLDPFYRAVLRGAHRVGMAFNHWHPSWVKHILQGVNRELLKQHSNSKENVYLFLEREELIDKGHDGAPGDRCYSILKKQADRWRSISYGAGFPTEVSAVLQELANWRVSLQAEDDLIFHEKDAWIGYIDSLGAALREENTDQLIVRWSEVDRAWMKITGPIQTCHPLEYYEDHFRQSVALEWDLRISNPEHSSRGKRRELIRSMAAEVYSSLNLGSTQYDKVAGFADKKLDMAQLHIGRSAIYYGSMLTGLPSAQVVPNDETVSKDTGKKIFAFPDHVLQSQRSRPFLRLSREVYEESFLKDDRKVLFQDRPLWFQLYDISTIGHEYGHILWVDDDSEAKMNVGGNYKNVEEWKATTGGLLAFFLGHEEQEGGLELQRHVLKDLLRRAVGLMAWREASEVEAYYCEGMIHLSGLFESGVLSFSTAKNVLSVHINHETYQNFRSWFLETYKRLVGDYYLPKKDPSSFLHDFARVEGDHFMPVNPSIHAMAEWYWDLYQRYGREIDTSDHRDNYKPFDESGA